MITSYKISFYNLNRRLTDEEWNVLCEWYRNPENRNAKWQRGDLNHKKPGYVFEQYMKSCSNGEHWVPVEKFKPSDIRKPNMPTSDGRSSYFDLGRILTEEEWQELNKWREENPHLVFKRWDTKIDEPDVIFVGYAKRATNGEEWTLRDTFIENKKRAQQARNTPEMKAEYASRRQIPERKEKQRKLSARWVKSLNKEQKFLRKLRSSIRLGMKTSKQNLRTEEILGCSPTEFKNYIQLQFEDWMTCENYGSLNGDMNCPGPKITWDLDHIIPVSSAKSFDEALKLNHYTNFQPLCSYENRFVKR
ncbi:MAG TPA: HNH endonuclease signature motif containing protein, partial [Emticicia sp.]